MLGRKRSAAIDPSPTGTAPRAFVRRLRRATRTIRLQLSESDLEAIGEDVDRLLLEADDLALSPQSQNLLLVLDDEISHSRATEGSQDEREDVTPGGRER